MMVSKPRQRSGWCARRMLLALSVAVGCSVGGVRGAEVALPAIPAKSFNVTEFGAKGDGVTLNTEAFAKAIAKVKESGGGKLVVPPGIWFTGPITLCSNLDLHVEAGAVIQFSGDYKLYPLTVIDVKGEKEVDSTSPVNGQHLENVAITGQGILDGGGDAWRMLKKSKLTEGEWKKLVKSGGYVNEKGDTWWPSKEAMEGEKVVAPLLKAKSLEVAAYEPAHQYLRPKMVRLIDVKKLLIQDVTFQNPPNWTTNPVLCEDVSIINLKVRNLPTAQNSDALDLESCRRGVIKGCVFDTGDDGICIKSGKDEVGRRIGVPTEDVLVEDCVVYHAHGGFTIGSEMSGGVRNMTVRNCTFIGTDIGLRFKSARGRGGVVENIKISDIRMLDIAGNAIDFTFNYGGKSPLDQGAAAPVAAADPEVSKYDPVFQNITMENIVCRGAAGAFSLVGLPETPIRNITLKNAEITSEKGVTVIDGTGIVFENVKVESKAGKPVETVRVKDSKLELVK